MTVSFSQLWLVSPHIFDSVSKIINSKAEKCYYILFKCWIMCTDESGTTRQTAFIKKIESVLISHGRQVRFLSGVSMQSRLFPYLGIFIIFTSSFYIYAWQNSWCHVILMHWISDVIESMRWRPLWVGRGDPSRVSAEAEGWPWLTEALSEREKRARVNRDTMECRERRENGFLIGLGVLELSSLYAQRERIYHQPLIDCV